MKKISLVLLILISVEGFSQEEISKVILKATPSHIFDFDNSFNLAAEVRLKYTFSLQAEVGYGNTNQNLLIGVFRDELANQEKFRNFDVFRGRVEARFYSRKNKKTFPQGFYNGIEVFYKSVSKNETVRIGRDVINFTPEYFENVASDKKRLVYGSHYKIGTQFYIFDGNPLKKKHWLCDIFVGVGFRNITNSFDYANKRPNDQVNNFGSGFGKIYNEVGSQFIISGTLGFKIGYLI